MYGACGTPRRRDLSTSLALRDGRGEGGSARGQGPSGWGLSLCASVDINNHIVGLAPKNHTYYANASDVPRSLQSWVSTIHGCTHSWRFSTFYKTRNNNTSIRCGQNNRRQLTLSSAIPQDKHNQPCMVYGLVLQVRTYCAQYNIRKTTTNSSTIEKERDHSLCHPQFHTARTTNHGV